MGRNKKEIDEVLMTTQEIKAANMSSENLNMSETIMELAETQEQGYAAVGLYLMRTLDSLLRGYKPAMTVEEIVAELGCSRAFAGTIRVAMQGVEGQVRNTRTSIIYGQTYGKTGGRPKKTEMICPDIDDEDEETVGVEPWELPR